MRRLIATVLMLILLACSPNGRNAHNTVIPPERLKEIIEQNRKSTASRVSRQQDKTAAKGNNFKAGKRQRKKPVSVTYITKASRPDSQHLSNLAHLKSSGVSLDFSEPLNRALLERPHADSLFNSAITLSQDRVLKIGFDNDVFDYTDQFYTNGVRIELVAPGISDNPVKHILLPYWANARNYYGVSLVQNLYTPSTTKIGGILHGDRPFASYLYFGSFKVTSDGTHHYRQTSELDLGVIGKPSLGGTIQDLFHKYVPYNNEPLGWENQVSTDAVINYNFSLDKGILNQEHFQAILSAGGAFGTLYTNLSGGFLIRLCWFNDYFSDLGIRKKRALKASKSREVQYFFTFKGQGRLIAYDATLEGGLVNGNSPYTIPAAGIVRFVSLTSAGFTITIGAVGLELEQCFLSPEFNNQWWHGWGHVGMFFAL